MGTDDMRRLLKRGLTFGICGGVSTAVAYFGFVAALQVMPYALAAFLSWVGAVTVGFVLNRRFTFGIVGSDRRMTDFTSFVVGALLQLGIAEALYALLMGRWGISATPAFFINLVLTTVFSFGYLNLVAFRRSDAVQSSSARS